MKQARPWMLANLKIICQFHAHPVHQNRGEIFCAKIYWGGLAPYNLIQHLYCNFKILSNLFWYTDKIFFLRRSNPLKSRNEREFDLMILDSTLWIKVITKLPKSEVSKCVTRNVFTMCRKQTYIHQYVKIGED
jgi:hypothetical protein